MSDTDPRDPQSHRPSDRSPQDVPAAEPTHNALPTHEPPSHNESPTHSEPPAAQQWGGAQPTFYGDRPVYGGGTWWDGSSDGRRTDYHPTAAPYGAATATMPSPAVDTSSKPRRMRTTLLGTAIVAALIGGGVGAGTVALSGNDSTTTSSGITVTTQTAKNSETQTGTVTGAAAKITPSVVTITITTSQGTVLGSGVIIRNDGYILTNNHVVSDAGNGAAITVETSDGRTGKATIVGTDPTDDLAVIKVSGLSNLTAATFAKSADVKVGQTVVAVGAPLGLSDTVTSGIVSALARPVVGGDGTSNSDQSVFAAIQTDAAINHGNSGGPLVDLNGNVVGINAAIATSSSGGVQVPGQQSESGNIGIGFAIPSDEASRIASEIISTGKATHAVLGVTVNTNAQTSNGAAVSSLTAGGAAAKAGLQRGDVITKVGDTRVDEGSTLIAVVRSHAPGDSVSVTYVRDGRTKTATVTLGSATG